jgi:succinate dehydrogenase hydrophobic membrane anchor protein
LSGYALRWAAHRLTGAILVFGLGLHFSVMHFSGPSELTYEAVRERLMQPAWTAFNAAFLVAAIYHGLYGLWGIGIEYVRPGAAQSIFKVAVLTAGALLTATGISILVLIH